MRALKLRKQYPEAWAIVEGATWDDMNHQFKTKKCDSAKFGKARRTVAYNAAFIACDLIHKYLMSAKKK